MSDNFFKKVTFYMIGIGAAVFSFHALSPGEARPEPFMRWIQHFSGAIYSGMLFFQLCVLPKGSLQSTPGWNFYRNVFNTVFVFLVISILMSLPAVSLKNIMMNSLYGQVWIFQFIILFLLLMMSMLVKNAIKLRWITFGLSLCLLAADAMSDNYFAVLPNFFLLLSASVWTGSLVSFMLLLPLRKREEGKIFLKGITHLFLPWGLGGFVILAAAEVYMNFIK